MYLEEESEGSKNLKDIDDTQTSHSYSQGNNVIVIICVALSMLFMRSGIFILSFFFLVPLGYSVLVTRSYWSTFLVACVANIVISIVFNNNIANNNITGYEIVNNNSNLWIEIFYITCVFFIFIWIIGFKNIRTAYRLILGSIIGATLFLVFILRSTDFINVLHDMANKAVYFFLTSSENEFISPERSNELAVRANETALQVIDFFKVIWWRGGAIVSMVIIYLINFQLTYTVYKIVKKQEYVNRSKIINFFTPINTIWVLIGTIITLIITYRLNIKIIEILAWNVFTVCVILFLAQGSGITLYLLSKRSIAFKIFVSVAIFFLLISPINIIVFIALLLLGILEIWLPFRDWRNK